MWNRAAGASGEKLWTDSRRWLRLPCRPCGSSGKKADNEAYIQTLLLLLSQVEDTNILSRSNQATLAEAQAAAQEVLAKGGAFTKKGMEAVWELNERFVEKNISPGGCADLLILAIFLEKMEGLME